MTDNVKFSCRTHKSQQKKGSDKMKDDELINEMLKGISDIVPMQDLFNEWHAKNTSQKVRNVFRNKGMSGEPLTTMPPYGYMKNPNNPKE